MFCRACGKELDDNAAICMGCGVPMGKGSRFCPACGGETCKEAVFCVNCGVGFVRPAPVVPADARSRILAGILGIFFGGIGVHNFYLKRTKRAVIQLLMGLSVIIPYLFMIVAAIISDAVVADIWWTLGVFVILLLVSALCLIGSSIWAFVEAILLLCGSTKTDGRGRPLKD